MRLMDFKIWEGFFKFELSAQEFNDLPRDEQVKYFNTLKFMTKEGLTLNNPSDSEKMKRVFRMIDERVYRFLFS